MDYNILFGVIGTLVGIIGGIYGIYSNRKKNVDMDTKESRNEGQQIGTILTDLGYIKSSVDDIKRKQELADTRYIDFTKEITALSSFKLTAEDNINKLDKKISKIEEDVEKHFHQIETKIEHYHSN